MVFSSHLFLFYFLTASLVLYYLSPRWLKNLTLTAVSYVFYGWANPLFVVLMFLSTLVDYLCGLALVGQLRPSTWRDPAPLLSPGQRRSKRQRLVLAISMISNLSLLGFFKYFNFLAFNCTALVESLGLTGMNLENVFKVTLPLGISFYTFQSMSYAIDVYRGDAPAIRKRGKIYRLPTEAEWEYACRAGTTTRYSHSNDSKGSEEVGNVADAAFKSQFPELEGAIDTSDGYAYTSPAGSFLPNPFGLYDMHGNVWEWCADLYDPEYYAKSPTNDPGGPTTGNDRVYRGGGWFNCARGFRSASRSGDLPENRHLTLGFRVSVAAE